MLLKRSLSLVLLAICLSLSIGCSGDDTDDSNSGGEGAGAPNNAAGQVADKPSDQARPAEQIKPAEQIQQTVMKPGGAALDLTYISDDFTSAVIAHPARVLNSEFTNELVKAGLPLDDWLKAPIEEVGVDPRQVEQVVVLLDKETAAMAPQMLPIPLGPPGGEPGGFGPAEQPGFDVPAVDEATLEDEAVEEEKRPENSDQGAVDNPSAELQPVAFQPAGAVEGEVIVEEFGPGADFAGPPEPTLIVRFSAEMNPSKFFENFNGPPLEDDEIDGLKVKKEFSGSVFHAADSRTLIYTHPKFLKKMVEAKSTESGLITELKNIDATHDLIVVADLTPFRQLLQMPGDMLAARLPPDLAALSNIANKTKMLTLTAGVSSASLLSATFVMDTADDAQATNTALSTGLKQVQAMYEQQKTQGLPPDVPLDEAGQQEVIAMADEIIAGISNEANGNRLTVTIPKPGNFNKLAMLLKPAIEEVRQKAERAAEQSQSKNQLKLIGIAFHNYYDAHSALPGAGSDAQGNAKGLSWRVHLLPYLDESGLYEKFNLDEPWDSEHNKALIAEMPDVFKTPEVAEEGKTVFHVVVGENTAFQIEKGRQFSEFTDGLSNTILVLQAGTDKAEVWTRPGGLEFDKLDFNVANPPEVFGKESSGFKLLMADGRVVTFEEAVPEAEALKAMLTRNGGELVTPDDF